MKKTITVIIIVLILIGFSGAMYYLYSKNAEDPVVYETEKPFKKTIVKKTVATGSILPQEEVLIKPNISGVIDEIFVEGGDLVKANDLIAKIRVIPNLSALNNAKNNIRKVKISLNDETRKYKRQKSLYERNLSWQKENTTDVTSLDEETVILTWDDVKKYYSTTNQAVPDKLIADYNDDGKLEDMCFGIYPMVSKVILYNSFQPCRCDTCMLPDFAIYYDDYTVNCWSKK